MKLWKITHHHGHALPGATVHLLARTDEPTPEQAIKLLALQVRDDEGDSLEIEFSGFHVAPFHTDLLETALAALACFQAGDVRGSAAAMENLKRATDDAATRQPRSVIFVSGGLITDIFSTERRMDVSILDSEDMTAIKLTLQTVDESIKAGTADLYRLL